MQKMPKQPVKYNQLEKVVVNTGIGRFINQPNFEEKVLPELIKNMEQITGQRPATSPAKQSVAGFKLRAGTIVGLKVTLRGRRMIDFVNRLNQTALPRIRDFRGINLRNIDANGNLTIGIKEHVAFPEIVPETSRFDMGLEITFVPKTKSRAEAVVLYKEWGFPLAKK
jgi:large subunit ribosomal protein L5